MGDPEERRKLLAELEALKADLQDRKAALPAHTLRPHQWQVIEDLEEKIRKTEERVEGLRQGGKPERP